MSEQGGAATAAPSGPTWARELSKKWTTARLALVVVLGAIDGVLIVPLAHIWIAINSACGVMCSGPFQPFLIFSTLAVWLVPVPGAMLLTNMVLGFADFLAGDPSGVATIYWGLAGGVVGELAMWIFRYNPKRRSAAVILAAIFYIPATNVVTYFIFGWQNNWQLYVGLALGCVAIVVESAVPGILLGKWLKQTGLLRSVYVADEAIDQTSGWQPLGA